MYTPPAPAGLECFVALLLAMTDGNSFEAMNPEWWVTGNS